MLNNTKIATIYDHYFLISSKISTFALNIISHEGNKSDKDSKSLEG